MTDSPHLLILCIGNPLRGDDGVAHHVAAILRPQLPPRCRLIQDHQLFPEHAEAMGEAQCTILVDASIEASSEVNPKPFVPDPSASMGLHGMTLDALYGLCRSLYGKAPDIRLCSIPASSFDHSESLSAEARAGAQRAAECILNFAHSDAFLFPPLPLP